MIFSILADLAVIFHLLFIIFAILGGILVMWRKWIALLHLPSIVWVAILEFNNLICPLTPLENYLRQTGGQAGYTGGFIEHYLTPLIYPSGLTSNLQFGLGIGVITINLAIYFFILYRLRFSNTAGTK